jgi:hypothetical protein
MQAILTTKIECITVALVTLALTSVSAIAGGSGASTATVPDGRKIQTLTTRTHSECNVYSPQGNLMCTRTYPITNHQAAVAKCSTVKC